MSQSSNFVIYIPLFQTLLGGVLALLGGLIGNFILQKYQIQQNTNNLASAFYGEIKALSEIVTERKYVESLEQSLYDIRNKNFLYDFREKKQIKIAYYSIQRNYFYIYEKNADKIGMLTPPLPEKIARIYTFASSIIEHLNTLSQSELIEKNVVNIEQYLEDTRRMLVYTLKTGEEVQKIIRKNYKIKPPHFYRGQGINRSIRYILKQVKRVLNRLLTHFKS